MPSSYKPHRNKVAYQHNNLIRAPRRMGLIEERIFMQSLSDLTLASTEFPLSEIKAEEAMRGLSNGESYHDVHDAVNTLVERVVNLVPVHERGTRTVRVPLMSRVEFDTAEGIVRVKFNKEAAPYLLNLTTIGNYTGLDVQTALNLKNPNAIKMYSILESWKNLNTGDEDFAKYTESLNNLKFWLLENNDLYPIFGDFKRRILEPVFTDFARIGYGATWSPTKTGKKTTHVTFKIPRAKSKGKTVKNSAPKQIPNALPAPADPATPATVMRVNKNEPVPLSQVVQAATARQAGPTPPVVRVQDLSNLSNSEVTTRITTRLYKLKLSLSQIQKVFQLLGNDLVMMEKFMKVTHPLLRDFEAKNKPFDNLAASTITLLKSEFSTFYRDKEFV